MTDKEVPNGIQTVVITDVLSLINVLQGLIKEKAYLIGTECTGSLPEIKIHYMPVKLADFCGARVGAAPTHMISTSSDITLHVSDPMP